MGELLASRADVSRLLGRVAFGATAADLDGWTAKPYADLVEHLLDVPAPNMRQGQADEVERQAVIVQSTSANNRPSAAQFQAAQGWWLERMRTTRWPLLERLTLFWHDHFATGVLYPAPDLAMLMVQNQLLRDHALANFSDLAGALTVDPAMLEWLDGNRSSVGKPNENYAREFFELFTMGTIPQHFSESDIREAARAFTGWVLDGKQPKFDARRHDAGVKTILGRRITNQGEREHLAVRDAALAALPSARFIAYKLVQKLAYDPNRDLLGAGVDPLVAKVGDALRASGWNISTAVRTLLMADEFRYARQLTARQPVEQAVHACKALGVVADHVKVVQALTSMGQRLFDPPNVGGWPSGREWLSPGTTLARYVLGLTNETEARKADPALGLPVGSTPLPEPDDLVSWAARFGLASFSQNTARVLRGFLDARKVAPVPERQGGVMILIMNSPDWVVM